MGRGGLELAQTLLRVALAWHNVGSSTPSGPRVNDSGMRPATLSRLDCCLLRLPHSANFVAVPAEVAHAGSSSSEGVASQCSLHNAPIFRLLLKVAVNGTHQCESQNFCGALCPNMSAAAAAVWPAALGLLPSRQQRSTNVIN